MAEPLDFALISRLRDVLRDEPDEPATEADLRTLLEHGDAWERTLLAQIEASERQLVQLTAAQPETPLHEIAAELRRVESLRPQLEELRALLADLEPRARQMRTEWLTRQGGPK